MTEEQDDMTHLQMLWALQTYVSSRQLGFLIKSDVTKGRHRSFLTVLPLSSVLTIYFFYINYPFKKCHHFFKKDFFPYSHSSISVEVAPWQVVPLGCTSGPGPLRMYSLKQELINLFFKWLHSPSKTFIFMGHIVSVATTHLCHR